MANMGLNFGLERSDACFKRKFRWLFKIPNISAHEGAPCLPPSKAARPSLSFKEMEVSHLTEVIYYPVRPEWKPINLTLYDLKLTENPIINWISKIYDATGDGTWNASGDNQFKQTAWLELYDGCGNVIERWVFDNVYPQIVEFGDLDMGSNDVLTIDLTLRYDRAYIQD